MPSFKHIPFFLTVLLLCVSGIAHADDSFSPPARMPPAGMPASAWKPLPRRTLQDAEDVMNVWNTYESPMPMQGGGSNVSPPSPARPGKRIGESVGTDGSASYKYQTNWYGYSYENLRGLNGQAGTEETFDQLVSSLKNRHAISPGTTQIVDVQKNGQILHESEIMLRFGVTVQYWNGASTVTVQDVVRAHRSTYTIASTLDPRGNNCAPPAGSNPTMCLSNKGNPINAAMQSKLESEQDISQGDLTFRRTYNSAGATMDGELGGKWFHDYQKRLSFQATDVVLMRRDSAWVLRFAKSGTQWTSRADVPFSLEERLDANSVRIGWQVSNIRNDVKEHYDVTGRLERIDYGSGREVQVVYRTDVPAQIERVIDQQGRSIVFDYYLAGDPDGAVGFLRGVTDANGHVVRYFYGAYGNLIKVQFPDGTQQTYAYGEANFTQQRNFTNALTGVFNSDGSRRSTFQYDGDGRAVSTTRSGGAGLNQMVYDSVANTATVTDENGFPTTYQFEIVNAITRIKSIQRNCVGCGGLQTQTFTYDASGYLLSKKSFSDVVTSYAHDAKGRKVSVVDAASDTAGNKRTTQTDWHSQFNQPQETRVLDSSGTIKSRTTWTFNARGQILAQSIIDPATSTTRTTTYSYCEQADVTAGTCPLVGLLKTVDGPRADVSDITTYTYYMYDPPGCVPGVSHCTFRKGDLATVTNALGKTTSINEYDDAGRPIRVIDQNSVTTEYAYDARGRLTARKVRGTDNAVETDDQITRIDYWPTGLVKKVTQPDGAFTSYTYDDALRLTGIADNAGNSITYTLNAASERIKEDTKDVGGVLQRTLSRTYNTLGQLQTVTDAYGRSTGFTYDAGRNLDTSTDALSRVADNNYDALDRLTRTLQDMNGIAAETKFTYDALDNLTQVNDPKGLNTTYTYNGFGDLTKLVSPDTGTTNYTYDSAGNRKTQVDARAKTTTYGYDALNRLTSITYPTTALNTTYTYDTTQVDCTSGETFTVGRLTRIAIGSDITVYCYDRFGNLVRKKQTVNTKVFTLRYTYNVAGQLTSIIYPDGAVADYLYDGQGRVVEVGAKTATGTRQVLLTGANYYPFGPVSQWNYGNGRLMKRSLNQNYQPGFVEVTTAGGISYGYEFDEVGNLKKLRAANQADPPKRLFGYDGLNRLTQAQDGTTNAVLQGYAYDKTGNRTSATVGATTSAYTYLTGNHRINTIGTAAARVYDANGNTTSIPGTVTRNFVYGDHNRMTQYKEGTTVKMNYVYNGRGEQVRKYASSTTNVYSLYDEAGHWLGDYDNAGAVTQQAIWFGDLPVGVLVGASTAQKLHYIEADALGTPRAVVDPTRGASGTVVWNWDLGGEAFGTTAPNQNPDGDANQFVFNMRFPGQRYDSVSGLNYNYFRDYEAGTGRYVESDPIGLGGGVSTYGYVGGNALIFADPIAFARQGGETGQWWEYTDRNFQRWFHKCIKQPGDPDASREELTDAYVQWVQSGKPDGKNGCGGPPPAPVTEEQVCPAEDKGNTRHFWQVGPPEVKPSPVVTFLAGVGIVIIIVIGGLLGAGS